MRDSLVAGAGLCRDVVVRTIVSEGPALIQELIALGPQFSEREEMELWLQQRGLKGNRLEQLTAFRHTFSHFHLWIQPKRVKLKHAPAAVQEQSAPTWFTINAIPQVGLSAPAKQLFQQLLAANPDKKDNPL